MPLQGLPRERGDALRTRFGERGAVAVEFALILPVLLLLVFGIIQYGFYFWAMQGGSAAARDAARRASVGQPDDCGDFAASVLNRVDTVRDKSQTVTITKKYFGPDGTTARTNMDDVDIGDVVTVTVSFRTLDLNLPVPHIQGGVVAQSADSRVDYLPSDPEECDETVS